MSPAAFFYGDEKATSLPNTSYLACFCLPAKQEADGRSIPAPHAPFSPSARASCSAGISFTVNRSSLRGIAPYRWCISYRPILFAYANRLEGELAGKSAFRIEGMGCQLPVSQLRNWLEARGRGILVGLRSASVLSVLSAGKLVRDVIIAVGNCGFRRRFLWGRKSNEFAEYELSCLFLPNGRNRRRTVDLFQPYAPISPSARASCSAGISFTVL